MPSPPTGLRSTTAGGLPVAAMATLSVTPATMLLMIPAWSAEVFEVYSWADDGAVGPWRQDQRRVTVAVGHLLARDHRGGCGLRPSRPWVRRACRPPGSRRRELVVRATAIVPASIELAEQQPQQRHQDHREEQRPEQRDPAPEDHPQHAPRWWPGSGRSSLAVLPPGELQEHVLEVGALDGQALDRVAARPWASLQHLAAPPPGCPW